MNRGILLGFEPFRGHVSEYDDYRQGEKKPVMHLKSDKEPFSEKLKRFLRRNSL